MIFLFDFAAFKEIKRFPLISLMLETFAPLDKRNNVSMYSCSERKMQNTSTESFPSPNF